MTGSIAMKTKRRQQNTQKPPYWYQQSAALPFRRAASGMEILLITSRRRKRWILPKGIIEPDMSPQDSAAKEAFEEAGIRGNVGARSIGSYSQEKWNGVCHIAVFPFEVTEILDEWPERIFRQRRWVAPDDACDLLAREELTAMIRAIQRL